MTSKLLMKSTPQYAALALAITSQDWTSLGLDDDPSVAPSNNVDLTVERITALLTIRLVAIHAPKGKYQDLSTTTICRTGLMSGKPWPEPVTEPVIAALRGYVRRIVKQYQDVPYHNFEHCYHVVISTNKLLDLALNSEIHANDPKKPPMYGLREDPLLQFLLVFSALIHDVEHRGIPNRQLALEDDELAILYNDQSIAENRSLTIAFRELLKNDYANLKSAIFKNDDEYRRFRKYSTQIVLQTDIASPERTQIRKSKWKEAFGEEFATVESKVKRALSMKHSQGSSAGKTSRRASAAEILCEMEELPEPESLTATPEPSETGEQDIVELDKNFMDQSLADKDDPYAKPIPGVARTSIASHRGSVSRSSSMPEKKSPSAVPGDDALGYTVSENFLKFQRRISSQGGLQRRYHRLGISRSIDLSGEFIETYSRGSAHSAMTNMESLEEDSENNGSGEPGEEPDELKISVILEQILTAADIAHNLQGFGQMEKFSKRLYLELKKAHQEGRGFNPSGGWYGNQIAFLESYLLPLAQRLEDTGIFGPLVGPVFARLVESNRDEWLEKGQKVTDETIAKGVELYPTDEDGAK